MSVEFKVRLASPLRSVTGGAADVVAVLPTDQEPLAAILDDLEARYPGMRNRLLDEQGSVRRHVRLFVNGTIVTQLTATMNSGETLELICALSGG